SLSTSVTRDFPNASIFAGEELSSGKCRRVPEATPSVLWQLRQPAFSRTGYRPAWKLPFCAHKALAARPIIVNRLSKKPLLIQILVITVAAKCTVLLLE